LERLKIIPTVGIQIDKKKKIVCVHRLQSLKNTNKKKKQKSLKILIPVYCTGYFSSLHLAVFSRFLAFISSTKNIC
jgi:hypothetical protein